LIAREMFEEVKLKFLLIGHILGKSLPYFPNSMQKNIRCNLLKIIIIIIIIIYLNVNIMPIIYFENIPKIC